MSVVDHGRFTQPSLLTLISFLSSHKIPMGEVPDKSYFSPGEFASSNEMQLNSFRNEPPSEEDKQKKAC